MVWRDASCVALAYCGIKWWCECYNTDCRTERNPDTETSQMKSTTHRQTALHIQTGRSMKSTVYVNNYVHPSLTRFNRWQQWQRQSVGLFSRFILLQRVQCSSDVNMGSDVIWLYPVTTKSNDPVRLRFHSTNGEKLPFHKMENPLVGFWKCQRLRIY